LADIAASRFLQNQGNDESEQFLVVFPVEGRKEFSAAPADSGSFSDG
jgi:hypothetical protein